MSENDGQHRSSGNSSGPGPDRGMTGKRLPGTEVGNECGAEANMRVPNARNGMNVTDTTTGAHEAEDYDGDKD